VRRAKLIFEEGHLVALRRNSCSSSVVAKPQWLIFSHPLHHAHLLLDLPAPHQSRKTSGGANVARGP